ncbi:glycosyltransferase family 2 protein [Patescibacteria group bacterium]|nr:glycosyltransferase family 2 protein [Patescibacteria group bacterium]
MATLSVVLSVYNGASTLERTLRSVSWADEVVVVNGSSTDDTVKIAKKFTPRIFTRPNNRMLNVNKNFGFTKATGDWILSLDADEELTKPLSDEIRRIIKNERVPGGEIAGYWIPRKNMIFGKWIKHGLWWPDKQLRLFRRGTGKFPCVHVHEYLAVDGKTETIDEPYIHYNYDSIAQYLSKMETIYTESEVAKMTAAGYRPVWHDALRFPVSDFVKIYFAEEGYRDGLHGLVLSLLQSFYSLIVFVKLWENEGFPEISPSVSEARREIGRAGHEIRYWSLSTGIRETTSPVRRFWMRLGRRLTRRALREREDSAV